MISKLKGNPLGSSQNIKVTSEKVNEIISTINSTSTQIGKIIGFDMNSTSDQILLLKNGNRFIITDVVITNPSMSMTTAEGFLLEDAPSRGGNIIAETKNNGAIATLTSPTSFINKESYGTSNTLTAWRNILLNRTRITVGNTLYASLATPQGSNATCDIYVYGYTLY